MAALARPTITYALARIASTQLAEILRSTEITLDRAVLDRLDRVSA